MARRDRPGSRNSRPQGWRVLREPVAAATVGIVTIHDEHPFTDPESERDPARRLRGRLGGTVTLWLSSGVPAQAARSAASDDTARSRRRLRVDLKRIMP